MTPKRRDEDRVFMNWKSMAIASVGLICTLVAHIHLTGLSSMTAELKEIKAQTSMIPILVLRLDLHDKQMAGIEADLTEVKKKISELEMEVLKQISTVKE